MNTKRLIPLSAATVACALGAVPAWTSAASAAVQQATSANWSGYVIGNSSSGSASNSRRRFSSVTGSWVQPAAKCSGGNTYSAFWVGLGGSGVSGSADASGLGGPGGDGSGSSSTGGSASSLSGSGGSGSGQSDSLEQAGTEADCSSGGSGSYFAWYEIVPAAPVKLDLAIHAGDHITTKVTVNGSNMVVAMSNQTTGQSTSKTLTTNNPDTSSAEWIAEAPSQCDGSGNCTTLPLTDFDHISFTGASATGVDGHAGTISDAGWSAAAVQLNPNASSSGFGSAQFAATDSSGAANPSSLSSDGSSFSVTWSSSSGQTSSAGGGSTSGSGDPYSSVTGDPYGYGGGGYEGWGDGGYGGGSGYGYGGGSGWGDGGGVVIIY